VKLTDKRCWIVGATGAIGSVIAEKFAAEGAVIVSERIDVRRWLEVQKFVERTGPFHVLVNCSGVLGPVGETQDVPVQDWIEAINVNLVGSYLLTRAAIPGMRANGGGRIIHFSGGGAAYGRPYHTAYAASKAGLLRFIESVASEVLDSNIRINAIAPGPVLSKMNPQATGTADRAAELALFLATENKGLTGRMISAIHDQWETIDVMRTMAGDGGTLRRVPPCFE